MLYYAGMSKTVKEIQDILVAKWLHKELPNWETIVVDPLIVARENNIQVYEANLSSIWKDVCWYIQYRDDTFIIMIEESHHYNRKKFTLAHELWHFFLHQEILIAEKSIVDDKETLMFRWMCYSPEEYEANTFAAEYLMPEKDVIQMYKQFWVTEILANHFKVSLLAMAHRIDNVFSRL